MLVLIRAPSSKDISSKIEVNWLLIFDKFIKLNNLP
jgi:hypothetical protein